MSAHNPDTIDAIDEFNQGVSFGQHEARRALLPLLKDAREFVEWFPYALLGFPKWQRPAAVNHQPERAPIKTRECLERLDAVIADIEKPPAPPTSTPPTDDESIPF